MNVVITLPRVLIDKILSGEKKLEMRKGMPFRFLGTDGFFVIEKGTDNIRCFCVVDDYLSPHPMGCEVWAAALGVSKDYVRNYCKNAKRIWLWKIGNVYRIVNQKRSDIGLKNNPKSYVYTMWDYYSFKQLVSVR